MQNEETKTLPTSDSEVGLLAKLCCRCGKPASHQVYKGWETPSEKKYCCECYVKDGNIPSDWHIGCMVTYNLIKAT